MSIDLTQYGYPSADTAKSDLLTEMAKVGAVKLEASYSGGNDEGGVDEITVLQDADENDLDVPARTTTRPPREGDEQWQIRNGVVHEWNPLWEAADAVLRSEFGSWAGDFTAYGTLSADASTGEVKRAGQISTYDDDSRDY